MTKYYVYCLKNKSEVVYIGSTTKIINRLKAHKKDKEFDEVVYCQLPNKKTMLEVEAFGIAQKTPKFNIAQPNYSISQLPEVIEWKRADLNFLREQDVEWRQILEQSAQWEYDMSAMEQIGIPPSLYMSDLYFKVVDGKVIAVFDGTGVHLRDFIKQQGFDQVEAYVDECHRNHGVITVRSYEKSLQQFE